jgi:23S rRNA (uracil1939-C5)-methyltransferase
VSTTPQAGAKLAANGLDAHLPAAGDSQASFKRPERGEEIELQIDSLAHGGEGVGRLGDGGYVVFVSGALPGDRVRAVVVKRKRSYAHARMVEVLRESPERIAPTADHPGVAWQVLPYERQLQIKQEQVEDALRRIGRLEGFELEEIVPALSQWRYRNKLEYSWGVGHRFGTETSPTTSENAGESETETSPTTSENAGESGTEVLVCGFHAPGGWKRVDPIEDCLLASELGNRAREVALDWARAQGLRAWDRRRESIDSPVPLLRNLVVREGRRSGKLQIRLVSTDGELEVGLLAAALVAGLGEETLSGVLWTRSSSLAETTMGGETELVWGDAELPERLGELDLRISSEAFFQTNTEMAEVLYGIVTEYAALEGWERHDRAHARPARRRAVGDRDNRAGRCRRDRRSQTQRRDQRPLLRRRRTPGIARAARARRKAGRRGRRPAARRPLAKGGAPHNRSFAQAHRLRLLQPDDARPKCRAARRGGLALGQGAPGGHVPADATHRVRGVARADMSWRISFR